MEISEKNKTLDNTNAEEWKSEWLMNQVGVDALGNNKPMASEAEWDYEAKQICAIISIGSISIKRLRAKFENTSRIFLALSPQHYTTYFDECQGELGFFREAKLSF